MANAHAITRDPSVYSKPDKFNPDRYIPTSEGGLGEPLPVGHFGFGRR
jgi:cytochrome P450